MRSHYEDGTRLRGQRPASLRHETASRQRRAQPARRTLERERALPADRQPVVPPEIPVVPPEIPDGYWTADDWATSEWVPGDWAAPGAGADDGLGQDLTGGHGSAAGAGRAAAGFPDLYEVAEPTAGEGFAGYRTGLGSPEDRTEILVSQGRRSAYYRGLSRGQKGAIATAAACAVITILVMLLSGGSASWPASVATVQNQAARACQNPDVKSEPGQINFACARDTRQILWVFALLTSGNNPNYTNPETGRTGLEPITRAQGGALAWSLNLHHPYNPANPVDSLQVAARAINNIVGGATVTGATGNPIVQPGLESSSANCLRYTGSPALTTRGGFPSLCAEPVTSPGGQAALVADVYQKWIVGATPQAAHDAAVLFTNAKDPGDPQVQAILRHLRVQH